MRAVHVVATHFCLGAIPPCLGQECGRNAYRSSWIPHFPHRYERACASPSHKNRSRRPRMIPGAHSRIVDDTGTLGLPKHTRAVTLSVACVTCCGDVHGIQKGWPVVQRRAGQEGGATEGWQEGRQHVVGVQELLLRGHADAEVVHQTYASLHRCESHVILHVVHVIFEIIVIIALHVVVVGGLGGLSDGDSGGG